MEEMIPFVDYTPHDFTGFKLGEWHSSKLGVIHVSGGDRYEENLQPEINDITVSVPGMDGEYFFGSTFGTRTFDLELAFDHVNDLQLKRLRWYYGSRVIKPLIFDELPYKKYYAKIESPMDFSYVCFDEPKRVEGVERDGVRVATRTPRTITVEVGAAAGSAVVGTAAAGGTEERTVYDIEREQVTPWEYVYDDQGNIVTERIYKGEAKLSLKSVYPFARSAFKVLPVEYYDAPWVSSSGILKAEDYAEFDTYNNGEFKLYNPGDMQTGFRMYLPKTVAEAGTTLTYYKDGQTITNTLILNPMTLATGHIGVMIDTNNHLIQAVTDVSNDNYTTTSYLYNKYVDSGQFFTIRADYSKTSKMTMTNGSNSVKLYYDYLYF